MSVWSPSGSGEVHVDSVIGNMSVGWPNDMPYEVRMANGRHCVYKIGTNKSFGCHDTHGEALQQMAALYASEKGGRMSDTASFIVNMDSISLSEENKSWVHALPFGKYKHPVYGEMDFSNDRVQRLATSVKTKARGIEPSINYNHAGGEEAAGWIKDAEVRTDGLWVFVDWIKDAADKIREKKFRYFSSEFGDYEDTNGVKQPDVVFGGALTNRPFMKNLVPINLSESVIDNAFDLVSAITGKTIERSTASGGKEYGMKPEELQTIIEGVTAKLSETFKPTATPPAQPVTQIAKLEEISALKELADSNPMVKTLLSQFESQAQIMVEQSKNLRETQVEAKLAEFDNSTLVLTPAAKELTREILFGLPNELSEKFWALMDMVRTSQSFLVELGERSGAAVRRGYQMVDKNATQMFTERLNNLMVSEKLSYIDAAQKIAAEDPELWNRYRAGEGAQAVGTGR